MTNQPPPQRPFMFRGTEVEFIDGPPGTESAVMRLLCGDLAEGVIALTNDGLVQMIGQCQALLKRSGARRLVTAAAADVHHLGGKR